ncbi:DUF4232 domain-containing protein [Naasia sp. SYSU D00057]|uniref:DUF4232 domain-containing protein n=1 Tax=Naasia sp. SYSU D00057 TaxID=2817380 RepID=UPI001B30BD72|nr:DUF4232 domain-containing protein [Naasia sp. SYSU D00057]
MNSAVRLAALACTAAVLLTGCAGSPSGGGTTPPPSSPSASPSPTPTATPTPTGSSAAAEQCEDDALSVSVTEGDGAAGSIYRQIVFLNTGTVVCSLHGSPGVSVVGQGDGTQLGEPAEGGGEDGPFVQLQPGGTAIALLQSTNIGNDGGPLADACPTAPADGWRIYPPHSFEAEFVPAEGLTACTGTRPWMRVGVVEAP